MNPEEADIKLMEAAGLVSKPDATQRDADAAAALFSEIADAGYAGGMFGLAELKMSGRWVPKDTDSAVSLYERAAAKGNVPAMFRLGNIYVGDGKRSDPGRAYGYFCKCVEAGFPPAYGCLGDMHYYGIGTPKDALKAADLYMRAAGQGDCESMFKLGCMYEAGMGVGKDPERSQVMFLNAARGGLAEAQFKVASMIYDGAMPGGHTGAAKWYSECADHVPVAKFNLATMYFGGDGVEMDLAKAFTMYRELADAGDKDALMQVGKMYLDGEGVEQNAEEGFRWIGLAAKAGNEEAAVLVESLRRRQNAQLVKIEGAEGCGRDRV